MTEVINVSKDGPVRIIQINRSDVRNAINAEVIASGEPFEGAQTFRAGAGRGGTGT